MDNPNASAKALAAEQEVLVMAQSLTKADPANAGRQRELPFSFTRIAQTYEQQGNREEALHFVQMNLIIDEHLTALKPSNTTWQKDCAIASALVARLKAKTKHAGGHGFIIGRGRQACVGLGGVVRGGVGFGFGGAANWWRRQIVGDGQRPSRFSFRFTP